MADMSEMTNVKLDSGAQDAPMTLLEAIAYLRARGTKISRATLYRWNADEIAAGRPALIHQPSGRRGRTFVVPAEIYTHIRNRWSAPVPASGAGTRPDGLIG